MDGNYLFGETTMKMQTLIMGPSIMSTVQSKSREDWYPIFKKGHNKSDAKLRIMTKFYPNTFKAG